MVAWDKESVALAEDLEEVCWMAFCSLSAASAPQSPSLAILQVFLPVFTILLLDGITLQPCCHQGAWHSAPRCFMKPQQHREGFLRAGTASMSVTPEYLKPGLVYIL